MKNHLKTRPLELCTARLRLVPLDRENLRLSLENPRQMEANLGLHVTGHELKGAVREAVRHMFDHVLRNERDWLWFTNWQIVLKADHRIIGGFCFKGPANRYGEVEIGYGIEPECQNRGYMTEALRKAVWWATRQPGVQGVIAEAEPSNIASQAVLQKVGFVRIQETERALWWKLPAERIDVQANTRLSHRQGG